MQAKPIPPSLLSPLFKYVKAVNTDVQATWRRHGWSAPDPLQQRRVRIMLNRLS